MSASNKMLIGLQTLPKEELLHSSPFRCGRVEHKTSIPPLSTQSPRNGFGAVPITSILLGETEDRKTVMPKNGQKSSPFGFISCDSEHTVYFLWGNFCLSSHYKLFYKYRTVLEIFIKVSDFSHGTSTETGLLYTQQGSRQSLWLSFYRHTLAILRGRCYTIPLKYHNKASHHLVC